MKRIVSIILCLCMVLVLGACKGDNEGAASNVIEYEYITQSGDSTGDNTDADTDADANDGVSGDSTTTSSDGSSNKKVTVTNNCYSSGTKIAKDKVTLKVLIRDHTGGITNYNTCALTKWIEKNLNIKLQFTTCTMDEINTKLTLAYASKTNPYDLYIGLQNEGTHGPYIKQGKVQKLDKLIDTYGTNIKKMFKEYPQLEYLSTFDDGSIYSLPRIYDTENYSDLIYINTDWLKAVGKSLPTTTDEFKAVLQAFKNKYPDKLPFAANTDAGANIAPSLLGPFGISTYHNWFYVDQSTDTIKYALSDDKYRNALRYYNDLYASGLMKLIQTKDQILNMTSTDSVGAFTADDFSKCVTPENLNKSWTVVPVLNAKSGGTWANVIYENLHQYAFLITDACKYPEIAIRLADWMYSLEGSLYVRYGPEGNYWDWVTEGKTIRFNTSNIPKGKTTTEYIYSLTPYYGLIRNMNSEFMSITSSATYDKQTEATKASAKVTNLKKTLIKPNAQVEYKFPRLAYTTAENKTMSDAGQYNQYTQQMRQDFVTGAKSINNDWDSYISTLNSTYRIKDVEKVHNTAYKRYKAWMATRK